jgi:hypothetical protein
MHGIEEQSEGGKMEVDLVVTPELKPIKHKVTFDIENFFGAADDYGEVEGVALVVASTLAKVVTHFSGATDSTFFGTIVKDK